MNSFKCALAGIIYCVQRERNIKIHLAAAIMAFMLGWYLELSRVEFLLLGLYVMLVLIAEVVNTAIEVVVDLITPEYDLLAKAAKDIAAGAVLLAALASLIAGGLLFLPKLAILLGG
ncbi:MAG: diacylglycerol kinase family protein [Negativicutes bacterium]